MEQQASERGYQNNQIIQSGSHAHRREGENKHKKNWEPNAVLVFLIQKKGESSNT
jgi:hypothetical protein